MYKAVSSEVSHSFCLVSDSTYEFTLMLKASYGKSVFSLRSNVL